MKIKLQSLIVVLLVLVLLSACSARELRPDLTPQTEQIEQTEQAVTEEQKPIENLEQVPTVSQPKQQKEDSSAESQPCVEQAESSQELACSLTVRCDNILNNIDDLAENKHFLVPEDGVIYPVTDLVFTEGETVFDVLLRAMKEAEIHFEFVHTPAYNSTYIEGINNLYEFDCGELSGWEYCVNGQYLAYGCSLYKLQDGDVIEWHYTCDLGRDLNNFFEE